MPFSELLNALPLGIAFADRSCRLLWWNPYAEEIFHARDGLWIDRGGFRTARPAEENRLTALIGQASALGTRTLPGGGAMAISRPSLRRSFAVLVSPLSKGTGPVDQAVVAVLITDPERSAPASAEVRLAQQFGLTPAEARVANALLAGKTVEAAADELCIAIATLRSHVRSLLQKTGTSRQAELLRVLLSGPSLFR